MMGGDGWRVFMALYNRKKHEIKETVNYDTLADFKADRTALDIVDGIIEEMEGFKKDAEEAQQLINDSSTGQQKERGIMLIEAVEGQNVEG